MGESIFFRNKNRILSRETQQSDVSTNTYVSRNTPRELEVLCCVARGMKAKSIGKTLHITAKTVERHKSNIMAKLACTLSRSCFVCCKERLYTDIIFNVSINI